MAKDRLYIVDRESKMGVYVGKLQFFNEWFGAPVDLSQRLEALYDFATEEISGDKPFVLVYESDPHWIACENTENGLTPFVYKEDQP